MCLLVTAISKRKAELAVKALLSQMTFGSSKRINMAPYYKTTMLRYRKKRGNPKET